MLGAVRLSLVKPLHCSPCSALLARLRSGKIRGMKRFFALLTLSFVLHCRYSKAQVEAPSGPVSLIHASTSIVLVDVIAEETKGGLHSRELLTGLQKKDFRIFDDGREVALRSFDAAEERTARPIALWLVAQCNMGLNPEKTSGFMLGKARLLLPALSHLDPSDVVGVAHWCDDGNADVDLDPQSDPVVALQRMEEMLSKPAEQVATRKGELAMQTMIRKVLAATRAGSQSRLPVYAFFYGDHSATYPDEANRILNDFLETAGIVFGIDKETLDYNPDPGLRNGQIWELVHFYSGATGGDFYSVQRPELFSTALAYILAQVHHRYVLGFKPAALDSRRHKLRIELTQDAAHRYAKPHLKFRPEYIPRAQIQQTSAP